MNLKSVEEEAAACRERCKDLKIGEVVLHVHHKVLAEPLSEPIENRIQYILIKKAKYETPEQIALRLRLMSPLVADAEGMADEALHKASAKWEQADAKLPKAYAEWEKADAKLPKAYAKLPKAYAKLPKAYAKLPKTYAEWQKADAEWQKAYAEWEKAYLPHYRRLFPDSPWNGKTIFRKEMQTCL